MHTWLVKRVKLLLHIFLSGPASRRRPTTRSPASFLPSQRSCKFVILSLYHQILSFRNEIPLSPTSSLSPQSQGPPSPQHTRRSSPRPDCHRAVPSFDSARRKWYCSVCQDAFHDKYECERHIGNVGKQAMCLACGKTICARKDNRRRHYAKYCKRKDLGIDGGVSLENTFAEV
jgi:hypothetical protein